MAESKVAQTTPEKDEKTGRFLTGNNGGGRRKGSRNALGAEYVDGLAKEFEEHGQEAIARPRQADPATFLKLIGNILPKQLETTLNINILMEFEAAKDFAAAFKVAQRAREIIGAEPLLIEAADVSRHSGATADD